MPQRHSSLQKMRLRKLWGHENLCRGQFDGIEADQENSETVEVNQAEPVTRSAHLCRDQSDSTVQPWCSSLKNPV